MERKPLKLGLGVLALVILGLFSVVQDGVASGMESRERAIFSGGCFWCMEEVYEQVEGVSAVTSGYIGGNVERPTYEQVSAGGTGHVESVEVIFDSAKVSYQQLLEVFWRNIDPTVMNAQFCDHGDQYRSAIFYVDETQRQLAEESKRLIQETKPFHGPIHTEINKAGPFYQAEEYHQDFYKKNRTRYKFYKWSCGRAQRLEALWGKP